MNARDRLLDMVRAQEKLREARNLARAASAFLADLNIDGEGAIIDPSLDLKPTISLAVSADRSCQDAVDQLETLIRRVTTL